MIDFQDSIYLGVASPNPEKDMSNYYTKGQVDDLLGAKQDTLVSGTNIKTINSTSVLGSGNLALADQSLSNLDSTGQMVIDSQNGTISNCILDIPQNIKLEFSNGTVTLKAGSIITRTGSTYSTVTTTQDITWSSSSQANKKMYIFASNSGNPVGLYNSVTLEKVGSGDTLPANSDTYANFYLTTDKIIYSWSNGSWQASNLAYPLGIIETDENGNITGFAKDSNGNDMIFNGAGFVGHHAFVLPGVNTLAPNGFNPDGSLKSTNLKKTALQLIELTSSHSISITSNLIANDADYYEVDSYKDIGTVWSALYYVKDENHIYLHQNQNVIYVRCPFISYTYDGTTVTDFAIRQPVRTATVEMLQKSLGDVETLLAAI